MNKLILFVALFALFTTSVEGQKRKNIRSSKKAVKNKPVVKKTTKVTKKKNIPRKPGLSAPTLINSNRVEMFPRCSSESTHLNLTIYGRTVFTQAVKVDPKSDELSEVIWMPASNGWASLREGIVLKELFEQLKPDSLDVYPGIARYNSTPINMVVMIKEKWYQEDVELADKIMREYIVSLGFGYTFVPWECVLPSKQTKEESKLPNLQILQ